jgi:hypothetical protein
VQGPRGVTVFTASFRAVSASADTATSSRAGDGVIIRHIMASSWEVNTSAASGEGKSMVGSGVVLVALASPQARSAQIRGAVSVRQGSLMRNACRYVRRACMWVVCYSNCTWVGSSTVRTTLSHRAQQFAAVKAIASGRHSAGFP